MRADQGPGIEDADDPFDLGAEMRRKAEAGSSTWPSWVCRG